MKKLTTLIVLSLCVSCYQQDDPTEPSSVTQTQSLTTASAPAPYTVLTPRELAHATRPIWTDPNYADLKVDTTTDKYKEDTRRKQVLKTEKKMSTQDGQRLLEQWEHEKKQLERENKSEEYIEQARTAFKESLITPHTP